MTEYTTTMSVNSIDIFKAKYLNTPEDQVAFIAITVVSVFVIAWAIRKILRLSGISEDSESLNSFKDKSKTTEVEEVNLEAGQKAMDFIERLIQEKYNYYMYLELLPIYLDQKIPEKNIVKKIKEKIYVSVVGSLTQAVKSEMLKYFTEKGIEIYVNEQIIILMNKTDFRSAEKFSEAFREINMTNVDKLI